MCDGGKLIERGDRLCNLNAGYSGPHCGLSVSTMIIIDLMLVKGMCYLRGGTVNNYHTVILISVIVLCCLEWSLYGILMRYSHVDSDSRRSDERPALR